MNRIAPCAFVAALLVGWSVPAFAQTAAPDPPAHIAVVDGAATLERDGRPDPAPASMPLLAGDRLRTQNGRVEILFADGATLHLDTASTVDFQSDDMIRLLEGRVRLTIPGPRRQLSYRIDAPAGWVQIQEPGEYRVAVTRGGREPEVELVVLRGAADLLNENGQTALRAGERALARVGAAPSYAYVYNSAAWDAFDRWSDARRADRTGISAQYLPETVRPYSSTFDNYGAWRYDTSYGYVWYPTVSVGWRPYFYGRWASFPSFGWTWIGSDAWAWPTHHYGRWGFSAAGAWFWIPGRTWGPAWVSWAYAPGYVSWCPLGWDNRAVFAFGRASYYGHYDSWHAWTVVSHQRFGAGYVNASFIGGTRIDARTRGAFVVRPTAPDFRGAAVPRSTAPIYAAGSRGRGTPYDGTGGPSAGQRSGDARSRATVSAGPSGARPAAGADAAADFRNSRPSSAGSTGPGYPAPARAPRDSPQVVDRMGAPSQRTAPSRPTDLPGVTVYRGATPRQPSQAGPSSSWDGTSPRPSGDAQRLDVPGNRRAPSASQPAAAGATPAPQRSWSVGDRQVPGTPAPQRSWSVGERQGPGAASGQPGWATERGGRVAPERTPNEGYRAAPRQAPDPGAPPAYRSYGGVVEHRGTPSAPPPAQSAPREQGPPPSAGAPRGDARPSGEARPSGQSRPAGQGQPNRGGAVRRGGG